MDAIRHLYREHGMATQVKKIVAKPYLAAQQLGPQPDEVIHAITGLPRCLRKLPSVGTRLKRLRARQRTAIHRPVRRHRHCLKQHEITRNLEGRKQSFQIGPQLLFFHCFSGNR